MDKIDYNSSIDEGNEDFTLLKEIVDKINEIVDWINAQ
tara:strand:- start:161 stop:274 length:114 start_codon:yes stop_codon:yes gene_type:complete